MGSKILVVGATGLVGQEVVKSLVERDQPVKAASRRGVGIPGTEATVLDLRKPETFEPALADVDRVFLLTPAQALLGAETTVVPFVGKLAAAGIKRLVCMTGMTADRADAPMQCVEQAVKGSGLPYTLLRPNWFDQNFAPGFYMASINNSGGVFVPAGDAKLSFVDTRDIGEVAATALTDDGHEGKEYTLTGPEAIDHGQACAILSEAWERKIEYTSISDDQLREALQGMGMPPPAIDNMVRLYRITREGACNVISDAVSTVLGRPPIAFAQYARDYAHHFPQ